MSYIAILEKMRDALQKYVDNHADSENDDVVDRVSAYEDAINSIDDAIGSLEDVA